MSGTSMDGVDAALCEFDSQRFVSLRGQFTQHYTPSLRQRLLHISQHGTAFDVQEWTRLDAEIADTFVQAARGALQQAGLNAGAITAIGSHGQTVFHAPPATVQLGDPNRIAAHTGITTVADFRRRDLALGGQGAPLVPAFHHAQFADAKESRAVVNIGGIANVTLLPNDSSPVSGFDTGPGNALMDEWCQQHRQQPYDRNGDWAASGTLHDDLLSALSTDPYFMRPPPKSTGRGDFNLERCAGRFPALSTLNPTDVQRTFCELTARSIAQVIRVAAPAPQRVLLCGGGARNALLVSRLQRLLPVPVESTDRYGLDVQWVEAVAFAWLAMRTLNRLPGNLPAVTGASAAAVLGGVFSA